MSKMKKMNLNDLTLIVKNSGWVGIGQFFNILLRYVYTVVCTRLLGAVIYGLFVIGRAVILFISVLSEFGLGMAVQRQVAFYSGLNNRKKIDQSIGLSILLSLLNSIILAVLIFSFSDFFAIKIFKNSELSLILKLLSISIPIITLLRIFYNIFQGFKEIKYRIFLEYIIVYIANIFLVVMLVLLGLKIKGIIWSFILANFITLLGAFWIYSKMAVSRDIIRVKIEREIPKELMGYAVPLVFSSTLNFLQRWADTFLLGILSTGLAVGIYNVSVRLGAFVAMPLLAFNMIFSPMIAEIYAKKEFNRLKFNYQVVTKLVFTVSLLIYSIILLFPAELLSVFGSEFKEASPALVVLCSGQLINASVGASGWMLVMTGHPKIELLNSIIFILFTIILNLFLIPKYNVLGAGIANAVTLSVVNLARVIQIYRVVRIHPFRWDYLKPLAAFFLSVTMIFYLKKVVTMNLFSFFLLVSALVVSYCLFVFLLGLKEEEQWILLRIMKEIANFKPNSVRTRSKERNEPH
jgi:O-antigen/teichoic acid export membrane protein